MNFSIYNSPTGGGSLYEKFMNVTTDSSGVYNAILTDVNLNFSEQYYLGITVENDAEMTPRINLTSSPYAYMAQNVSAEGIIFDTNLEAGSQNITTTGTGFFGFLGSLASRVSKLWVNEINATGNIVTLGNVTAGYFIGDGSLLTGVGAGNADYSFGDNNFDGSGNFTTTGNVTANTYFGDGSQLTGVGVGDASYNFGSNSFSGTGGFTTTGLGTFGTSGSVGLLVVEGSDLQIGTAEFGYTSKIIFGDETFAESRITADEGRVKLVGGSGFVDVYDVAATVTIGDATNNMVMEYVIGLTTFNHDLNITGLIYGNASQMVGLPSGGGDAAYSFGSNSFSGTGGFTTTGLGTFGNLDVDNINIDGNTIKPTSGNLLIDLGTGGVTRFQVLVEGGIPVIDVNSYDVIIGDGALAVGDTEMNYKNVFTVQSIDGNTVIAGTLDMTSGQINNLANGTASQDAVTKSQLDAVSAGSGDASYSFGANNFDGTGDFTTTGTGTFGDLSVTEANDGGDTSITILNSAGSGSTDETTSLKFRTVTQTAGRIESYRIGNYQTAQDYGGLKFYVGGIFGSDPLAIDISSTQDGDITTNMSGEVIVANLTTTEIASFGSTFPAVLGGSTGGGYFTYGSAQAIIMDGTRAGFFDWAGGSQTVTLASGTYAIDALGDSIFDGDLNVTGAASIGTTLDMTSGQINNLANGTAAQDAVTKSQLDAVSAGGGDASYSFGANSFSGTGGFTTTGTVTGEQLTSTDDITLSGQLNLRLPDGSGFGEVYTHSPSTSMHELVIGDLFSSDEYTETTENFFGAARTVYGGDISTLTWQSTVPLLITSIGQLTLSGSGGIFFQSGTRQGDATTTTFGAGNDMTYKSDGTNGIISVATALRLGSATVNYTEISPTGNLEFYGSANTILAQGNGIGFGAEDLTTTGNITAEYFIGDGSQLTGVGTGNANYQFTTNNFNGSGNFITTGNLTIAGYKQYQDASNNYIFEQQVTGSPRFFFKTNGEAGGVSPWVLWNPAGGAGMLFANDAAGTYKGGIHIINNSDDSIMAFRVYQDGSLTTTGTNAKFYVDGGTQQVVSNYDLNVTQNLSVSNEIQLGNGVTMSQVNGSIVMVLGTA